MSSYSQAICVTEETELDSEGTVLEKRVSPRPKKEENLAPGLGGKP